MAEEEDKDSKTHEASEQKIRKAREKGDVPISKEIGHVTALISFSFIAAMILGKALPGVGDALGQLFLAPELDVIGGGMDGVSDMLMLMGAPLIQAGTFFALCLAVMGAGAVVSAALQGPFVVSAERIMPKGHKLSPLKGIKKIFGKDNLVEFGKNLVKLTLIVCLSLWIVWGRLDGMLPGGQALPEAIPGILRLDALKILLAICLITIPIAVFDNIWKRMSFAKKQRMSQKELKDEHKQSEGDPMVKARRMQMARRRIGRPIRKAVPEATIIITNPTHYAVALRYERGVDMAPVCVAKGTDLVAAKIRAIAHEHEIPIMENRPLARALHAGAELDQPIPEEHWPLVADLIGYIMALRQRIRRPLPPETVLRDD